MPTMHRWSPAWLLVISPLLAAPPAPVTGVAYRASGKLLAAGMDRGVVIINPDDGTVADRIEVPGPVTALAFSHDGAVLAIASGLPGRSGEVRLVAMPPGDQPPRVIEAHADLIYGLAFSGRKLATGSYDRLVKLWDVETGRELFTLKDHADAVYGVAFAAGDRLVSCGVDRAVKVWDTKTGRRLYSLTDATDWLYAVAVAPDGNSVAAAGVDKSIRVWALGETEGKLSAAFFAHDGPILRLAYSPDGATLYSLAEDRRLKTWNPTSGAERSPTVVLPVLAQSLAVRPDGKQFAVGRHDGTLTLHDGQGQVTQQPLPEKPSVARLQPRFVPAGRAVRVTAAGSRLDTVTSVTTSADVGIKFDESSRTATRLVVDVTLPDGLPPGNIPLTFRSPNGDATATLTVDRFDESTDVRLDTTLAGACDRAGAVNTYRFELAAGQEVGAQVTLPPGSKLTPVLEWRGADGAMLASGETAVALTAGPDGSHVLQVRDREYRGGPEFTYRLHVGRVPVVTSVEPLGLPRGATREIQLHGVHLPVKSVQVTAAADAKPGSRLDVPIKARSAVVGRPQVVVGEYPEPDGTTTLTIPSTANGKIAVPGQVNSWTFTAKKGHRLVVETHARRLGSPLDSAVEITDAEGRPVERARLRCVARSTLVLRDIGAADTFMRLDAWNELAGDDFVLVGAEVVRVAQLPGHPDADCDFYQVAGRRQTYFDTTPSYHSEGTPVYKVQVLPSGTTLSPNGLPAVPLYFRNDDGGPGYDKDSRVIFDPPADGTYQARVSDARGNGGEAYVYRLTVRPPRPDFRLKVEPTEPRIPRGQGQVLAVTAERFDDFDGPITVRLDGLPAAPTVIEAGQTRAAVTVALTAELPEKTKLSVVGDAMIGGRSVVHATRVGTPKLMEPGDIVAFVNQQEVVVKPGHETHLQARIERRNGFAGRVPLEVKGLPHGVRVLHIGLNGIMITEKETARRIVLYAEPWVEPTTRAVCVVAKHEEKKTDHAAPPVVLRVTK